MMCSCDQLRKLVANVRPEGRMSLEPWHVTDRDNSPKSLVNSLLVYIARGVK